MSDYTEREMSGCICPKASRDPPVSSLTLCPMVKATLLAKGGKWREDLRGVGCRKELIWGRGQKVV